MVFYKMRLPKESQNIEKILKDFSHVYSQQTGMDEDTAETLAYTIIALATF